MPEKRTHPSVGRRIAWFGGLTIGVAVTTVLGWTAAAWSAPQTFNSAITLVPGEFVVREQYLLDRSGDDPSGADRDRLVQGVTSVLGWAVNKDLMLFGVLPYLDKRLESTVDGARRARSTRGIADLRLFGRYTVFRKNFKGGLIRVSPFAGLEFPTGDDDDRDTFGLLPASVQLGSGSWDPFGGLVATYQTLDFEIDGQIAYQANTEGGAFEFGDVARADASIQYRIWPPEIGTGVPAFVYGVLEANLIHRGRNEAGGVTDPNSGGTTLFLVPGLQYASKRWVFEAAVQVPVFQDLNGTALEKNYVLRAGFRVNF